MQHSCPHPRTGLQALERIFILSPFVRKGDTAPPLLWKSLDLQPVSYSHLRPPVATLIIYDKREHIEVEDIVTNPLVVASVSAGAAIVGSLLTIFITPRLQHRFWKRQRRAELRLTAINELARAIAEFDVVYSFDSQYIPNQERDKEFLRSFRKSTIDVRALFPSHTFEVFKRLEQMITGSPKERTYERYFEKQRETFQALYGELGLL